MISIAALLALAPAVLASTLVERTGPTGVVVPNVVTNGKTYCARGCFDELKGGLSALTHDISSTITTFTVENCVAGCASAGYSIAGVMNGNQCMCDNAMSIAAPSLDPYYCDKSCAGNSTQVCGGVWHYDVYSTTCNNAIPSPTAPITVGSGNTTYTSLGCYVDSVSARTLANTTFSDNAMTPALCAAGCAAKGFRLAGVEFGHECYCGDNLINANLTAITECNQACAGDSTQTCGAADRVNVYSLNVDVPPTPTNPPKPATTCGNSEKERYLHQGCYVDNARQRTLNGYSFTDSGMTATMCSSKCYSKGFKYAGLEGGDTCYCGNTCPRSLTHISHCDKPCNGDKKHVGGGSKGSGTCTIYKSYTLAYDWHSWPSFKFFW